MNLFQTGEFELHSPPAPSSLSSTSSFRTPNKVISRWKLDCDALTYDDFETLADYVVYPTWDQLSEGQWQEAVDATGSRPPSGMGLRFTEVVGIPNGGLAFAAQLQKYCRPTQGRDKILIVDDVYTTGTSMYNMRTEIRRERPDADITGLVIFCRGKMSQHEDWVTPLFVGPKF